MKKEYKKAHLESNLVVGEYYHVAHVNVKNTLANPKLDIDVPVIPIWHNDEKDFNFHHSHYHIDGRFVNTHSSLVARVYNVNGSGFTSTVVSQYADNYIVGEVFYKRKKCLRIYTGVHGIGNHFPKFVEKYKGKSCKGRKCPHWGTLMNEVDGVLVCPMHRLIGSIEEEIII
jgi:hypothetical protein